LFTELQLNRIVASNKKDIEIVGFIFVEYMLTKVVSMTI